MQPHTITFVKAFKVQSAYAFNVFIRQSLRVQGLPFEVSRTKPNAKTLAAMHEAELLARDTKAKSYKDMDSLIKDLQS